MRRRAALTALATAGAGGCAWWRPATVPLGQRFFPSPCGAAAQRPLLVLLPGRYMALDELVEHGFVAAVHAAGFDVDVMLVDAHLRYYTERTVVQRLHEDVVRPARQRGVTRIWWAGISLGGTGALLYDDAHPGDAEGLLLLAPYLGEAPAVQAVVRGGGLCRWQPSPPPERPGDPGPLLWRRLRQIVLQGRPPLWLGYGTDDRFAPTLQVLADALPAGQVVRAPGGHDWAPWQAVWKALLADLPLPRCR